jgi:hypothetical protein
MLHALDEWLIGKFEHLSHWTQAAMGLRPVVLEIACVGLGLAVSLDPQRRNGESRQVRAVDGLGPTRDSLLLAFMRYYLCFCCRERGDAMGLGFLLYRLALFGNYILDSLRNLCYTSSCWNENTEEMIDEKRADFGATQGAGAVC